MGMRIGYINNELQLLNCIKNSIWSTYRPFKYFKTGDYLLLVTNETYTGFVALAQLKGEPFESKKISLENQDYKFRYPIEFIHIIPLEERVKINKMVMKMVYLGGGLLLNQEILEEMYEQKSIKPKSNQRYILEEFKKLPNYLEYYIEYLDELLFEAERRPEMHWNENIGSLKDNENALRFPLIGFPFSNQYEENVKSVLELGNLNKDFYIEVQKSVSDGREERNNRMKTRNNLLPETYQALTKYYKRNPDVVAEVLERAKGICEKCVKPAPFNRAIDGTPYLEVHHIIRLADGGDDTVLNAIAVCPNCHRELHFG